MNPVAVLEDNTVNGNLPNEMKVYKTKTIQKPTKCLMVRTFAALTLNHQHIKNQSVVL